LILQKYYNEQYIKINLNITKKIYIRKKVLKIANFIEMKFTYLR